MARIVLVAQSCPTLCDLHGPGPTRHLCPWDFSGKNIGVGCHFAHNSQGNVQVLTELRKGVTCSYLLFVNITGIILRKPNEKAALENYFPH